MNYYKVAVTWPWLAGMYFCPRFAAIQQCHKLSINYILQLHVESFIPARRDPSLVLPESRFGVTNFFHYNHFSPPKRDENVI